jgi:AraC-like DNA-binding protein
MDGRDIAGTVLVSLYDRPSVPAGILRSLAPALVQAPFAPQAAVAMLYANNVTAIDSVQQLAARVGTSARTLERWASSNSIAAPDTLLTASRIAHAWSYLANEGLTVEATARICGFRSPRTFQAQCRALLDVSPKTLSREFSPESLLAGLVRIVRTRTSEHSEKDRVG